MRMKNAEVYIVWISPNIKKDIKEQLIKNYPEYSQILEETINQLSQGQELFDRVLFHHFNMKIEFPRPLWKVFRMSTGYIELNIY
ncbi:MAG: hypothetical protein KatS3mg002_0277 [Candidatus Woesearchaeota archaeon]|nr:MAG: hypothetical protein KatS3mg002_0277 [Candidatus Woesearchaeota archaeon]